jgi:FKBP-type peptidyl-prolyl cis-trans isomerase SlyD
LILSDRFGAWIYPIGLVFTLSAKIRDSTDQLLKSGPFMKIEKNTAVTLRYKLTDPLGKLLEQSQAPMVYLHGGYDNTFPKLEAALEGQIPGFQTTVDLQPEDAFGLRDESLVQSIPKNQFPAGVKVGGQLQSQGTDGQAQMFRVTKIKGDTVMLDGNHPLAGKALRLSVSVADVRLASEEEIAHRHVHGEHGHHH